MASGGELAFVSLRLMVKFLDNVFFVLGKGLLATLLTDATSVPLSDGSDDTLGGGPPPPPPPPPPSRPPRPRRAPPPPPPNPPVAFSRHPTATP